MDVRQCLHATEVSQEDSSFKLYSRSSCLYECVLRMAAQEAGCLLVTALSPKGQTFRTCLGKDLGEFHETQTNLSSMAQDMCHCPADCKADQFRATLDSVVLLPRDCLSEDIFRGVTNEINERGAKMLTGIKSVSNDTHFCFRKHTELLGVYYSFLKEGNYRLTC